MLPPSVVTNPTATAAASSETILCSGASARIAFPPSSATAVGVPRAASLSTLPDFASIRQTVPSPVLVTQT
jgi:hypothetical protein